jgi:hypothetical protein
MGAIEAQVQRAARGRRHDEPYGGLFGVPSASMRDALADMMR